MNQPMSVVYLAWQMTQYLPVALVVLVLPEGQPTQVPHQFRAQFLREAPALMGVRRSNLVPLYAYGE